MQTSKVLRSVSDDIPLEDIPVKVLESFIPGFGVIRRFLIATFNFDITVLVTGIFILFAVVASVKYVSKYLLAFGEQYLTSTITITSNDKLHEEVMHWISKQHVTENARTLSASTRLNTRVGRSSSSSDPNTVFHYGDLFASIPPIFSPYFGTHWFWQNGQLFFLKRSRKSTDLSVLVSSGGADDERETIALTCLGRSSKPVKDLLQLCKRSFADERRSMTTIRYPAMMRGTHWQTATTRPSRAMNTVYLDQSIKSELLNDVYEFLHPAASKFYASRGIPYRRGFLFYGPPGTGKTSLSLALAGVFGLELHVISLVEPTMTDQKLSILFSSLPSRCVVLLEDVDTAGLRFRRSAELGTEVKDRKETTNTDIGRKRSRLGVTSWPENDAGEVSLSGLLNALDGVASQEGRILIMTTNDPETLDKALIRPGRVDMQVYFGYIDKYNIRSIFTRMYTNDADTSSSSSSIKVPPTVEQASIKVTNNNSIGNTLNTITANVNNVVTLDGANYGARDLEEMAARFADKLPDKSFTPAEVQGFLLTRRKSPRKALEEVEGWRDELLAAKARGTNIVGNPGVGVEGVGE